MITKSLFVRLFLAAMVFFAPMGANSQVTIGSANPPSRFSLLDLDTSEQQRALHNARLTTAQRDALVTPDSIADVRNRAVGLLLFNTDTNCLEFWNGTQWVSLCDGQTPDPCAGFDTMDTFFCTPATIADLTQRAIQAGGNGGVQWFAAASGGTALDPSTALVNGVEYWADNCAGATDRVPVLVSVVNCNVAPVAGIVTAWTNAMYDFQSQRLSIVVSGGDNATSWQWQVSEDATNWSDISGATQPTFTIPANFVYDNDFMNRGTDGQAPNAVAVDFNTRGLYFRVVRTNPAGSNSTDVFNMLFIRTNTSGYATVNGARGLNIPRAGGGHIRMALLNLGATNDNSLGHLHQWGRRDDGHQVIVWKKDPITGANMFDDATNENTRPRPDVNNTNYNTATGQPRILSTFFFTGFANWGISNSTDNTQNYRRLWGHGIPTRLNFANWQNSNNNPCAVGPRSLGSGWRVPSHFEFGDIHINTVGDEIFWERTRESPFENLTTGNRWIFRDETNGAVGGIILTTDSGEAVFLPAVGWRLTTGAFNDDVGTAGRYWSATFVTPQNVPFNALNLAFQHGPGTIDAASTDISGSDTGFGSGRALGLSIRCVRVD